MTEPCMPYDVVLSPSGAGNASFLKNGCVDEAFRGNFNLAITTTKSQSLP